MAIRLENRIPPPAVGLLVAALMYAAAWLVPAAEFDLPWRRPLAIAIAIVGAMVDIAAVVHFLRMKTTVNPLDPAAASKLVVSGLFRISRNPMYVGMAILLVAWGIHLANVAALALVAPFILYMNRFQIEPEERALRARFGAGYDAYRARVRRWL